MVLTRGYWLAETACTQELWQAVMKSNPSNFKENLQNPVDSVSWKDIKEFIGKLYGLKPKLNLCLPTEAQWEYACRAGTTTPFSFGENITSDQVNYNGNYPYTGVKKGKYQEKTMPVKSFPCNQWGLSEMHGNVWEWCADRFGNYPAGQVVDPQGPSTGDSRVLRGGGWYGDARYCRSACRLDIAPGDRYRHFGFRLSRGQEEQEKET